MKRRVNIYTVCAQLIIQFNKKCEIVIRDLTKLSSDLCRHEHLDTQMYDEEIRKADN